MSRRSLDPALDLMRDDYRAGAFTGAFVVAALDYYARQVLAADPGKADNHLIDPRAWQGVAAAALAALERSTNAPQQRSS